MKIKDFPTNEKPREKLIKFGPSFLTNSELLAIILRTGCQKEDVLSLSNKLFNKYNLKSMSSLQISVLKKELGIGDAKACQIVSCFELGKRLSSFNEKSAPIIKSAKILADLFIPEMGCLQKEEFRVVYLDTRMKLIKSETIFVGSLNESLVHPRDIFKRALEENSAAIIIMHNHPSGNSEPSSYDIETTKSLIQAGELLGISVLDHIIIGFNEYTSLKERGDI